MAAFPLAAQVAPLDTQPGPKRLEASVSAGDDRIPIDAPDNGPCPGLVVLGLETIGRVWRWATE